MKAVQVAIDGPAGAGKSTIAKKIAKELNYIYIDTGAMYRALTFHVLRSGTPLHLEEEIIKLAKETSIVFEDGNIYLNQINVNEEVRSNEVSVNVSFIAQIPEVREILVAMQKTIAANHNVVMDGRDIGTNVLPNATLKIFLTASVKERARRRYQELHKNGTNDINLEEIEDQIQRRDEIDAGRSCSPLVKAEDAILIDTTGLAIDEVCSKIIKLLNKKPALQ
ncbi:(d)CMP kinase [Alkaliphilus hydrothermalis]|uniref:Cytidylate kinase n=1 Tax=Alkaliphilus hydrothermalis TaxID=1482730 RepID=A0ABS2NMG4_9FIRM|nr:(d)CMP kinase [Alkaliphilus hydrothermalis]MBM7614097.1 cytidylate kinase [Alkaliphilus hydrothermalis]